MGSVGKTGLGSAETQKANSVSILQVGDARREILDEGEQKEKGSGEVDGERRGRQGKGSGYKTRRGRARTLQE